MIADYILCSKCVYPETRKHNPDSSPSFRKLIQLQFDGKILETKGKETANSFSYFINILFIYFESILIVDQNAQADFGMFANSLQKLKVRYEKYKSDFLLDDIFANFSTFAANISE